MRCIEIALGQVLIFTSYLAVVYVMILQ